MVSCAEIVAFLDVHLDTAGIDDHSCNGLQVQGAPDVERVGLAVDACMEAYRMAVAQHCQLLVVHHGLIWGGLRSICSRVHEHVAFLIKNELGLYASHLPLDLHAGVGNNARLAEMLGVLSAVPFGKYHGRFIGFCGTLGTPCDLSQLARMLDTELGGTSFVLPFGPSVVRSVGIVSGGGSDALEEAIDKGLDCLITGESQHQNHHLALEGQINVIYGGHYHTEKPGVQALGELLNRTFGITPVFLDIPTRV